MSRERSILQARPSGGVTTEREWDPTLFAGAAEHYERGRLPYSPALADTMAHHFGALGLVR